MVVRTAKGGDAGPSPRGSSSRGARLGCAPTPARHDGPALIAAPPPSLLALPARVSSGVCARSSRVSAEARSEQGEHEAGGGGSRRTTGLGEPPLQMDKPPKHFRCFPRGTEQARTRSKMAASQPLRITSCRGVRTAISATPPSGAETAASRDAFVAVRPRRKATAPPAGRREFLQPESSLQLEANKFSVCHLTVQAHWNRSLTQRLSSSSKKR
ncbi:uncharacterized protein LOC141569370 [Rhinolophus sinicus]|uniref:uncharacterized protein LOC141569370 n=1 Tax=Rhinolophus sinicus TaxID=89399 RepID=UPI003D7B87D8